MTEKDKKKKTTASLSASAIPLEHILAASFMVPLVKPGQHPSDPTVRWGLTLNIIGLSGIAKTVRIGAACHSVGLVLQTVIPANKQPEDFGGMPYNTGDGLTLGCALPQANKLINIGKGVMFFDELSCARPAVQSVVMGVVDTKTVGDTLLPPKVRMLTAMNPPEYAASGFELEAPMANRLAHITYDPPTAQEWVDYQMGRNQPEPLNLQNAEQLILDKWDLEHPQVKAMLCGFLAANPMVIHNQPEPGDSKSGRAWPSHRMWEYAMCAITTVRCLGLDSALENLLLFACIGDECEVEWLEWCEKMDIPHPEAMLTQGWYPDADRLDITALAIGSMVEWLTKLKDKNKMHQLGANAWNILDAMLDTSPDMALVAGTDLCFAGMDHDSPNPALVASASRVMKAMHVDGYTKHGRRQGQQA